MALADDALDAVDEPDRLDAAVEHAEERTLVAFVHGVVACDEPDVGGNTAQAVTIGRLESREDRDLTDLVGRHHGADNATDSSDLRVANTREALREG